MNGNETVDQALQNDRAVALNQNAAPPGVVYPGCFHMSEETPMKLYRSALIESGDKRMVEMDFTDGPPAAEAQVFLLLRLPVDPEGYPPLQKAQLEALQNVRTLVNSEIQRLEGIRGPSP